MTVIDATLPKKDRILIAAEDVFSRRGYTKATLDEIIALADTGKGTLYKYFGNKDNADGRPARHNGGSRRYPQQIAGLP